MFKHFFLSSIITVSIINQASQKAIGQQCSKPNASQRTEITDINSPNNYIGQIIVHRKWLFFRSNPMSTFSLISPNVIVTAGHTFRNRFLRAGVTGITIRIGQRKINGVILKLSEKTYDKKQLQIVVNPIFKKNGLPEYDYSYAALPENVSSDYFLFKGFDETVNLNDSVSITGYPGDKGQKKVDAGQQMWIKSDIRANITVNEKLILYSIFTSHGDSGAPVWVWSDFLPTLVAIHGTGNYHGGNCNGAVKLTTALVEELQGFIIKNKIP